MDNKHFIKMANEKRQIVRNIDNNLPTDWVWMMVYEGEEAMTIELRYIPGSCQVVD